ncbi:MAG: aminotransferase class V-fold PLP-dependent enzyme [Trichlorobacter sp.]|nr:aminotransferase class V-fold PLP-dependent enzyme [Trichlorobacter sp.]
MSVYLDCNATTPVEPAIIRLVQRFMERDYGNAASPIHDFGEFALMAVEHARGQIAEVVASRRDEVIFTSGATEANNMALLGLAQHGLKTGKRHLISSSIEHKAVLEPLEELAKQGFDLQLLPVDAGGRLDPQKLAAALRPDTLLVSTMQVNNETGISQPLAEISEALQQHEAFWHVDAAQGFGKEIVPLQDKRIDLISISGHKIYAPKGIGVLIARKRDGSFPPLTPLMFGGGQEQGFRPGTLPVHLIAGIGEAAKMALRNQAERADYCRQFGQKLRTALTPLQPVINGDAQHLLPHTINISLPGIPSDKAIKGLKRLIAVSSTSACTSHTRTPSHVLSAMGLPEQIIESSIRLSWSHLTPEPDWEQVVAVLQTLREEN